MKEFDNALLAFEAEEAATKEADARYAEAKAEWEKIEAKRTALHGLPRDKLESIAALVKKYGPKAAALAGLPSVGAFLNSDMAGSILDKIVGLFG